MNIFALLRVMRNLAAGRLGNYGLTRPAEARGYLVSLGALVARGWCRIGPGGRVELTGAGHEELTRRDQAAARRAARSLGATRRHTEE